ncbi:MAG TPA: Clp protease N-terminal domain-containing protein [Candidatus Limnocylindrales bacterium]
MQPKPWGPPDWIAAGTVALIQQSQREAQECGHTYIDIEHMLLAALHDSLTCQAIRAVGAEPPELRAAILAVAPPKKRPTQGDLMFTPRAKDALDARRIAHRLGHHQVGPQHILLNILGSRKSGPVLKKLKQLGVSETAVRVWLDDHDR